MKQVFLFLTGLIFTVTVEAKKIPGKIFFPDDTIDVILNIPVGLLSSKINYESTQKGLKYYDLEGKKIKLKPADATEVRFNYKNKEIRLLSRLNSLEEGNLFNTNSHIFLKLLLDGEVKLFKYFFTRNNGSYNPATGSVSMAGGYQVERYVLQKGDGELKRPKSLSFRKDMIDYFNECPALTRKIEEKEFRKAELEAIVLFYNESCKDHSIFASPDF